MAAQKKNTNPTEAAEQIAYFKWIDSNDILAFSVPNGMYAKNPRHVRGLKFQGLRVGVPDVFVAHPTKSHHGLFVEMKRVGTPPSAVSPDQRYWLGQLKAKGYQACVCRGAKEAIETTKEYLGIEGE